MYLILFFFPKKKNKNEVNCGVNKNAEKRNDLHNNHHHQLFSHLDMLERNDGEFSFAERNRFFFSTILNDCGWTF